LNFISWLRLRQNVQNREGEKSGKRKWEKLRNTYDLQLGRAVIEVKRQEKKKKKKKKKKQKKKNISP